MQELEQTLCAELATTAWNWTQNKQKKADNPTKPSYVYFIISDNPRADCVTYYIGATIDLDNRLRCHNGEIANGARRTHRALKRGFTWSRVCFVTGFPTWRDALRFESRWQRLTALARRRTRTTQSSIQCGMSALRALLSMEKSSTTSIPYDDWPLYGGANPTVTFEPDFAWVEAEYSLAFSPATCLLQLYAQTRLDVDEPP